MKRSKSWDDNEETEFKVKKKEKLFMCSKITERLGKKKGKQFFGGLMCTPTDNEELKYLTSIYYYKN